MASPTLAVVDDDAPYGQFLSALLRTKGYEVQVYESGEALLDGLRRGALPDVILLDVVMPGLDGLETLRQVRFAHPVAQVVMISGQSVPSTIVEATKLGATDFVVKGETPESHLAIEVAVRAALERLSLTNESRACGRNSVKSRMALILCGARGRQWNQ